MARLALLALIWGAPVLAFNTSFTGIQQCQQTSLTWNGPSAAPPFDFLLVPINATVSNSMVINVPDTVETWNATSGSGAFTLPAFPLPGRTQYIAVMDDGNGFGTGGVSVPLTVGDSPEASCLSGSAYSISSPKLFSIVTPAAQCQVFNITWNPDAPQIQDGQVYIRGYIPGGDAFALDKPKHGASFAEWDIDIQHGTQFILLFSTGGSDGLATLLETSQLYTVEGNEKSRTSCFIPDQPSSTISVAPTPTLPSLSAGLPVTSSCLSGDCAPSSGLTRLSGPTDNRTPIIIGAVTGALAFLLLCGFLAYLWRRRHRHALQQRQNPESGAVAWMTRPRPYILPSNDGSSRPRVSDAEGSSRPRRDPRKGPDRRRPRASRQTSNGGRRRQQSEPIPTPDLDLSALDAMDDSYQNLDAASSPIEIVRHQDGGPVSPHKPASPSIAGRIELPPLYEDASRRGLENIPPTPAPDPDYMQSWHIDKSP